MGVLLDKYPNLAVTMPSTNRKCSGKIALYRNSQTVIKGKNMIFVMK